MSEQGFYEQKRLSPTSLAVVIALHGAAIGALMMSKMEFKVAEPPRTAVEFIPDTIDPPPAPDEVEIKTEVPPQSVTHTPPIVDLPIQQPVELAIVDTPVIPRPADLPPIRIDPPAQPPAQPAETKREPVRVAAVMRDGVERQPPYPASEQRAGVEGSVTVRLVIGPDGRVKSVSKVRGGNDAFFRATERQALRHWRFRPATVDGQPVESVQTVTVHFEMTG